MLNGLLARDIVNSLGVFLLGMVVIFLGLAVLIFTVWLQKNVFKAIESLKDKKENTESLDTEYARCDSDGEISVHVRLAIIAAIAAYYDNADQVVSEFKVKRIKRIR